MKKLSMDELNRKTVQDFKEASKTPIIIVLDNVRSMHNVGSIFRTADAFLIEAIFICGYTPQPPHRDINKTALGATETVDWLYFDTTTDAVAELKNKNYKVWAVEQVDASVGLNTLGAVTQPTALILGNEVEGVSTQVLAMGDGCIEIPQLGTKHSFNVSVAIGIVLWQMVWGNAIQ